MDTSDIYYDQIQSATAYVRSICSEDIQLALILGTGLAGVKQDIEILHTIPYSDIPHFPVSTVQSHEGQIIIGVWHKLIVLVMSGRFHYYEGYTAREITFSVRVISALGIGHLWISNVAGGLQAKYQPGDLILITDHINLMPDHPLRGPNDNRLGLRFPDMKKAYSQYWIERFESVAAAQNIGCYKGVYVGLQGPSLETPAEYNYLHVIGGDVVGMSTVPEVIVAQHAGLQVHVCSVVSNVCFPKDRITETTIEEVIAVAHQGGDKLKHIWESMVKNWNL